MHKKVLSCTGAGIMFVPKHACKEKKHTLCQLYDYIHVHVPPKRHALTNFRHCWTAVRWTHANCIGTSKEMKIWKHAHNMANHQHFLSLHYIQYYLFSCLQWHYLLIYLITYFFFSFSPFTAECLNFALTSLSFFFILLFIYLFLFLFPLSMVAFY